MMSRILFNFAFGGQARSGKSTAAEYLQRHQGGLILPIAGPLYSILEYAQNTCDFSPRKDRQFLQWVGTDWAREEDENVWINLLMKRIGKIPENVTNIYVPDVRFPNEVRKLRDAGFLIIRVERDVAESDPSFGSGSRVHDSETALDSTSTEKWDFVVQNNSTITEFYGSLDKICYQIEYSQRINDSYK